MSDWVSLVMFWMGDRGVTLVNYILALICYPVFWVMITILLFVG
jgi:hypothetical protein